MYNRYSLRKLKRIPPYFFIFALIFITINLLNCFRSIGDLHAVQAVPFKLNSGLQLDVPLTKGNLFTVGSSGTLNYRTTNSVDALLVNLSNTEGADNLYDLFYLLIVGTYALWLVYDVNEENIFSERLFYRLKFIALVIFLYPVLQLIGSCIAASSIECLTDEKFTIAYKPLAFGKFVLLAFIFLIIPYFIVRGVKLQRENNLTI